MSYRCRAKPILFSLMLAAGGLVWAGESKAGQAGENGCHHPLLAGHPEWPLPDCDRRLLFFVQRAMNANTVVYWANLNGEGKIDPYEPVEVFWLRFNTTGERKDLSFMEDGVLFGVTKVDPPDSSGDAFVVINGHKDQVARISLDADGYPIATAKIGGRELRLSSAFVDTEGDGKMPDIHFIDVYGTDLKSGETVVERVYTK